MPGCAVHKWCGGGISWGEIDMPLNKLFVITGCSRADRRTDAPINFSSCPLHTPSGGVRMLLEKMLNLGMRTINSPVPQAFSTWGLVKSQNEELAIWMVPRFVLLILRENERIPEKLTGEGFWSQRQFHWGDSLAPKFLLDDKNFIKVKKNN